MPFVTFTVRRGLSAADKTLVGSYHLPFPGFGHVLREGSGYRWLPADWQWTT